MITSLPKVIWDASRRCRTRTP